jgi:YbbR domain-containing protein
MTFAICRIQKIKSWGVLARSEVHTSRLVDIPNANSEIKNIKVVGNDDNLNLATLVRDKIGSQKIRSDAVLAVEMLLSASAEYFRPHAQTEGGSYDKPRLDKFVDAVVNWLDKSWGNK